MAQKANPIITRIGIVKNWRSTWFGGKNFGEFIVEDAKIRQFIAKKLAAASVADVKIERFAKETVITIYSGKPGFVIGRSGAGIDDLRGEISKIVKNDIKVNVEEARNPDAVAAIVAGNIAHQLEKRISYRRAAKQALEKATQAGAEGIKVNLAGRLGGAEMSRRESFIRGRMPLSTFRSDIDYAFIPAFTTYGAIGIKVWIYKGEVFEKEKESQLGS